MNIEFKDKKIVVLKGGVSCEREVSLSSGREAYLALKRKGLRVEEIDITTRDEQQLKEFLSKKNIDIAFIALHGEFGEDGKIQSILEDLNVPYTGSSSLASALAMDKIAAKKLFCHEGIPTPSFEVYRDKSWIQIPYNFPKVVKPHYAGSSIGVSIVEDEKSFCRAIETAFSISDKVIVEDYIRGRELTVGILQDRALAVVEIRPKRGYYDYNTKYSDGLADFIVPAPLDEAIYHYVQAIALKAHRVIGCRHFSRVDIRLSEDNIPYVLEVNTIPGLTSHSLLPLSAKAIGVSFEDLIVKMIELAFEDALEKKKDVAHQEI